MREIVMMVLHLWRVGCVLWHGKILHIITVFQMSSQKEQIASKRKSPPEFGSSCFNSLQDPHHHVVNNASRVLCWCNLAPSQKTTTLWIEAIFLHSKVVGDDVLKIAFGRNLGWQRRWRRLSLLLAEVLGLCCTTFHLLCRQTCIYDG